MILTDAQLQNEIQKCEYCEEKPCTIACPAGCSPADFLMAAKQGQPSDYLRAALQILSRNPLGGVCGHVCPDKFCMEACARAKLDCPVNIPDCQATIIHKARELAILPIIQPSNQLNKLIAIFGGGPSGWSTAVALSHMGYQLEI
ncbi:MAG: dihydropyrimidine dehydrogenase, partial [Candidatus Cloacimonetes bacterium]|nr:dihydropyrimidine dehydrogenase [Candidatus Cloacimonadota bacterium]